VVVNSLFCSFFGAFLTRRSFLGTCNSSNTSSNYFNFSMLFFNSSFCVIVRRRGPDAKFFPRFLEFCVAVDLTCGTSITPPSKILAPRQNILFRSNLETMANNNIVIDLASEAAGLHASTAPLPLFPSDAKLVEKEEFQAIRLALLRLVEREGAQVQQEQVRVCKRGRERWR
jgi:hypothetical protein